MSGRGAAPKDAEARVTRHDPVRGDWSTEAVVGWQHGEVPEPPEGLMPASLDAWKTWFGAWFAAHWSPVDVPALRHLVGLYDQVERGKFERHNELRLAMDTYGITPKGQQDRRWSKPTDPAAPVPVAQTRAAAKKSATRRGASLRILNGGVAS